MLHSVLRHRQHPMASPSSAMAQLLRGAGAMIATLLVILALMWIVLERAQ